MRINLIKDGALVNVVEVETIDKAQTLFPGFDLVEALEPEGIHPSFADVKSSKAAEVDAAFERAAAALTAGYPMSERLTWAIQQSEALAWQRDANAPTPYLDGLAAVRGIAPLEMRQKTSTQVDLFMAASQALVGQRQKLRDLIEAIQDGPDALALLAAIRWEE